MQIDRRRRAAARALFLASLLLAGACHAEIPGAEPFSEERFRALQSQGALVLVDVAADWCPTCKRQARILAGYREARPDVALSVLRLDFDAQKDWVKKLEAPRQSTLILFRGSERVWFSVAETDEAAITAALDQAVGVR